MARRYRKVPELTCKKDEPEVQAQVSEQTEPEETATPEQSEVEAEESPSQEDTPEIELPADSDEAQANLRAALDTYVQSLQDDPVRMQEAHRMVSYALRQAARGNQAIMLAETSVLLGEIITLRGDLRSVRDSLREALDSGTLELDEKIKIHKSLVGEYRAYMQFMFGSFKTLLDGFSSENEALSALANLSSDDEDTREKEWRELLGALSPEQQKRLRRNFASLLSVQQDVSVDKMLRELSESEDTTNESSTE